MTNEGDLIRDFSLFTTDNNIFRLSEELNKHRFIVLFFFPRANTPGCSREASKFQELLEEFEKFGVKVIGISTDKASSQKKFKEKLGLKYTLLSDEHGEVSSLFGVLRGKSAERVTFIIDNAGRVVKMIRGVKPEEHPAIALQFIRDACMVSKDV